MPRTKRAAAGGSEDRATTTHRGTGGRRVRLRIKSECEEKSAIGVLEVRPSLPETRMGARATPTDSRYGPQRRRRGVWAGMTQGGFGETSGGIERPVPSAVALDYWLALFGDALRMIVAFVSKKSQEAAGFDEE